MKHTRKSVGENRKQAKELKKTQTYNQNNFKTNSGERRR